MIRPVAVSDNIRTNWCKYVWLLFFFFCLRSTFSTLLKIPKSTENVLYAYVRVCTCVRIFETKQYKCQ